ncbi:MULTISPECIES: hypothetical protein [Sphingobacterium]|uniref:hypothetical protein n=1 Tax=Sphingobacterium TaxID=28453 RepID=UPI00257AA26D|nr:MULTISPECIES: hypothetical protein [Sphingobacterium]
MDKLKLEHLAPYLPYGLNVISKVTEYTYKVLGLSNDELMIAENAMFSGWYAINNFKPILRPLSDLTKEIQHNEEMFVPKSRIDQYTQIGGDGKLYLLVDGTHWSCNPLSWDYSTVLKLISWHFDVFGLIEKGLAIDYNTVKGGPNEI